MLTIRRNSFRRTLLEGIEAALTELIVDGAILKGIGVLLEGDVLESELFPSCIQRASATISLLQALKSTFRVVVKQFEQSDFALTVELKQREDVSSALASHFGVVAQGHYLFAIMSLFNERGTKCRCSAAYLPQMV